MDHSAGCIDNMICKSNKIGVLRYAGAVLSGLMLAASFPGWSQSTLIFTALVPLLLAVQSLSVPRAAVLSWLSGMVFYGFSLSWFWQMTNTVDAWVFRLGTCGALVFIVSYCALYFIPFGIAAVWCGRIWHDGSFLKNIRIMIFMTALWTGLEYVRGVLFTGFGWNALGISQYANPATIQVAEWGGVALISAVIVWMNMGVFLTIRQYVHRRQLRKYRPHFELILGLVPLALSVAFGMQVLFGASKMGAPVQVGLIQPNIPQTARRNNQLIHETRERLETLSSAALRMNEVELLVWPETALPDYVRSSFSSLALVNRLTSDGVPLLVGTMDFSEGARKRLLHNSALLFDGGKEAVGTYHKQHLVPFGEYVPFPNLLRSLSPLDVDFTAGRSSTLFTLPGKAPFSVLICFEDTISALARKAVQGGARWLINQTNDAWFDPSFQSEQHLAHAVFRCVENRVPMVRSCNTGVTAIIDSFGRVNRRLKPQTSGFLVGTIYPAPLEKKATQFTKVGDRFAQAMMVAGGVVFLLLGWRVQKTER